MQLHDAVHAEVVHGTLTIELHGRIGHEADLALAEAGAGLIGQDVGEVVVDLRDASFDGEAALSWLLELTGDAVAAGKGVRLLPAA